MKTDVYLDELANASFYPWWFVYVKKQSAKKDADTSNVGLLLLLFSPSAASEKKNLKKQHIKNCYYDSAEETQPQSSTLFHNGFSQLKK